jgi:hypothetical protein
MRVLMLVVTVLCLALSAVPGRAQEAEQLRKDLDQMRQQLERAQQDYQKAIQALTERLQRLEARPQTAATQPVVVQAPPSSGQPTLMEMAQPRQPFGLYERRTPGQFLFDLGVVGDFVANFTQRNVDRADRGTFRGRENRLFPREIELLFFGQIDPYARGEVRVEAAEEFEDGARENHVGLAEANLTLLALPFGTQLKLGQMRSRWGLLNQSHREGLPQTDQPNVLTAFFGEEGLVEKGIEATWVAPLPFYLEALIGAFNGDNEEAFGRGSLRFPLITGRLRTFLELERLGAVQLGASVATGDTAARRTTTVTGGDLKYKFTPEGWRHALLTLAGEYLHSHRTVDVTGDPDQDGIDTGESRRRDRSGFYTYAEIQPWRRWLFGVRYDNTQYPLNPGREWAVEPYLAFMPSEFLRFRLGYKHTDRSHRDDINLNGASARILDELLLQATFFLGAHPAHPF